MCYFRSFLQAQESLCSEMYDVCAEFLLSALASVELVWILSTEAYLDAIHCTV